MRALVQRVSEAGVTIEGNLHAAVKKGLLILLGVTHNDAEEDAKFLAQKCSSLRIFEDDQHKMNFSVKDVNGEILVISQFTLYADTRKGNRPNFMDAARPELAQQQYEEFLSALRNELGVNKVHTGIFSAMMDVHSVNTGPVTIMLESK